MIDVGGAIPAMASVRSYQWKIYVLRGEAHYLGVVEASDSNAAITTAIEKFRITERERRKIFAQRVA